MDEDCRAASAACFLVVHDPAIDILKFQQEVVQACIGVSVITPDINFKASRSDVDGQRVEGVRGNGLLLFSTFSVQFDWKPPGLPEHGLIFDVQNLFELVQN